MNTPLRSIAALLAFAAPASAASAAPQTCLTAVEAQALITSMLPDALQTVAAKCRPTLPADALLVRSGDALIARYRPVADAAFKTARGAFARMVGSEALANLDDETVRKLFAAGVAGEITKSLKPQTCMDVDRVLVALEPLPPENMSMLIGTVLELTSRGSKDGKKTGPFEICPSAAAAK